MPEEQEPVEIVVCLGSSCFARGNAENLSTLRDYASHGEGSAVRLNGCLCQDECRQSPNIRIGGTLHHGVTPDRLQLLLRQLREPWDESWSAVQGQ